MESKALEMSNSQTTKPGVLAIILNWNGLEFTRECCASLTRQTYPNLRVVVVDNGSTTHTIDDLHDACPKAEVVSTGSNLGFAGGVNAGLGYAAGSIDPHGYVWLLNNDTICDPDALERLVAKAGTDPMIGAVGCQMEEGGDDLAGTRRIAVAGKRLRPPLWIPAEPETPEAVDYICGASMLIRLEVLRQVGNLDDGYFFFFEDADWCFAARAKGWKLGVADGVFIKHKGSATIKRASYNLASYYRAGHVRFLRKHSRHPFMPALLAVFYRILIDAMRLNFAGVRGNIAGFRKAWGAEV